MKYDVSVFMPTIRTHLLEEWLSSIELSCPRHSFEAVLCGPFSPPISVLGRDNVKWIKSFASPTICSHLAALASSGGKLLHSVDDAIYYPDVVSDELDTMSEDVIKCMRYREGKNYQGHELSSDYWYCRSAYSGWPHIKPEWGHGVHFMISTEVFKKVGGFDCRWDYCNHSVHDFLFRIQKHTGFRYELSKNEITSCDHLPMHEGDHSVIHHAQIDHDAPLFQEVWGYGNGTELVIDSDNWKNYPEVWERRFTGSEGKYSDLKVNV